MSDKVITQSETQSCLFLGNFNVNGSLILALQFLCSGLMWDGISVKTYGQVIKPSQQKKPVFNKMYQSLKNSGETQMF